MPVLKRKCKTEEELERRLIRSLVRGIQLEKAGEMIRGAELSVPEEDDNEYLPYPFKRHIEPDDDDDDDKDDDEDDDEDDDDDDGMGIWQCNDREEDVNQ